jgi:glycosyltransferase involved in cell wall biosynthesis
MRTILYLTYDGLTDSLGQSQILAYLKRLKKFGNKIIILSYEKADLFIKEGARVKQIVDDNDLIWIPLRYTKNPPVLSTLRDIRRGWQQSKILCRDHTVHIVHCRGYIAAIIGRKLQKKYGVKFIFDMRGWWPDEKLESGFWSSRLYKPVYRYFKKLEKEFFAHCDYAVSLTYKGREEIVKQCFAPQEKIGVIPTCVDFEIFKEPDQNVREQMRLKLGIKPDEKLFVYSGSLGGNYDPDILINIFRSYQKIYAETYLLILSKENFDNDLLEHFKQAGISRMSLHNAPFEEVSGYLRAADVGFIYYKLSFSVIGRSPTKMGEYWASGIPVIALKGIGDLDTILEKYNGGGLLLSEDKNQWENELNNWTPSDAAVLRSYALDYFHVDKGVEFYQSIYQRLYSKNGVHE